MRNVMSAFLLVLVLWGVGFSDEPTNNNETNDILALVLQDTYLGLLPQGTHKDGGFTVVKPETALGYHNANDQKKISQTKDYITKRIQIPGYDLSPLVGQLFEKNQKSSRLTLQSDPSKGYIIDYDGQYDLYFKKGSGGWEKWYKDHPDAHGMTTVSIPVVDKRGGIVLVYRGTQSHWIAGAGYVIAYKYKGGKLEELGRARLWIS